MSVLDTVRCSVLNASYDPLPSVSSKRGLILYLEGKAHIIEEHPDYVIHSATDVWPVPVQIVLKDFAKSIKKSPAILNQKNLFTRDNFTCQYCGRHKSKLDASEKLTRDHVFPTSKGGKDVWKNVVTACSTCNNKKSNYLLEETSLVLKKEPTVPTVFELWCKTSNKKYR